MMNINRNRHRQRMEQNAHCSHAISQLPDLEKQARYS